jgi:hypothetical protein
VRLDLLDQHAAGFKGFKRNVFRPLFLQEADTVKRKLAKIPPPPPPPPPLPPPPPPPPPTPLQMMQGEVTRFVYLGFLQKEKRRTLFLSRDNQIYLVKKGDKLLGKFEVTALTDTSFTVKAPQDGSELVVPLVENKQLAPLKK